MWRLETAEREREREGGTFFFFFWKTSSECGLAQAKLLGLFFHLGLSPIRLVANCAYFFWNKFIEVS